MPSSDPPSNTAPTGLEPHAESRVASPVKRLLGGAIGWGAVVLAMVLVLLVVVQSRRDPSSTVATLQAPALGVASRVGGPVQTVHISDNQFVEAGQILFEIDPAPYKIMVDVAAANYRAIKGDVENARREIEAQVRQAAAAEALVTQARVRLDEATETYERLAPLLDRRYASPEEVDTARRAMEAAAASLLAEEAGASAARFAVADIAPLIARLEEAAALLAEAELALHDCTVRSPVAGRIVGCDLTKGAYVTPGVSVFMMLDTSQWHVTADFPEHILHRIVPGQPATVQLMTAPSRVLRGEVESIGWAVTDLPRLPIAGVPFIRRELDWVRLTQRFPVRIRIDEPDLSQDYLRAGATATVTIHTAARLKN